MTYYAIWEDLDIDLSSYLDGNGTVQYRIELEDYTVIFNGRACAAPDGSCTVRVNDICANYLRQTAPTFDSDFEDNLDVAKWFWLCVGSQDVENFGFLLDYSYDSENDWHEEGDMLNAPIRSKAPAGFPLPITVLGEASVTRQVIKTNGQTSSDTLSSDNSGTFWEFPEDDWQRVIYDGKAYDIVQGCSARYALYYVNEYGGWDMIAMKGTALKSDTIVRHVTESRYTMDYLKMGRGRRNHVNEMDTRWGLRTGLLTDDEASRMHHLLGSTNVFLADMETYDFLPVIISDTNAPYYNYRNNGNNPVEYVVNVELAQSRIRR